MSAYDEYLRAISRPESGNILTNVNPRSGAYGLYQIMPATAQGLRRQGFDVDLSTAEGQTRAASELTRQNDVLLRSRLRRDPTDTERYFAHGFGGPAAAYLLANPDQPLETALRTFYGGTRYGERFADRIFEQNPNLRALRDRPVSETVADFGRRMGAPGAAPTAPRQTAQVDPDQVPAITMRDTRGEDGDTLDLAVNEPVEVPPPPDAAVPSPRLIDSPPVAIPPPPPPPPVYNRPRPNERPLSPGERAARGAYYRGPGTPRLPPEPEVPGSPRPTLREAAEAQGAIPINPLTGEVATVRTAPEVGTGAPAASAPAGDTTRALLDAYGVTAPPVAAPPTGGEDRSLIRRFLDFMGPNNPDVQRGVERLREAQDQARQIPTGPGPITIPGTAPGMGGRATPAPATETPPAPTATLPPLPTLAELMEIGRRSGSTVVSGGEGQTPAPAAGPPGTSGQSAAPPAGAGGGGGTGPAAAGSGAGPAVAGRGGGGAADVPSPDYARVLALMEQMANPQRPDRDAGSGGWSRGWQEFLAGLGAGGGSLGPGSTVASVLGAGGRGSAEYRVTRGREEREAERAYEQARQEGQGRAAQLGLTMMGQQQQAALSRAELAQRRDEMMQRGQLAGAEMSQRDRLAIAEQGHRERISAAERLSREQIESSRLASQERSQTQQLALGLYQQQVRNIVAQAQIEAARARQSGTGQPFGTAGQQLIAHGLVGRFLLRADEEASRRYGADWTLMRATAQGQNVLRDIASHMLMTTEEGIAALRQWRGALTSRMPTGSTALTGTED